MTVSDTGPTNTGRTVLVSLVVSLAGVILFFAGGGWFTKLAGATLTFVSVLVAKKTLLTPRVIRKIVGSDLFVESQKWPFRSKTISKEPLSNFLGVQLVLGPDLADEFDDYGWHITEVRLVHPNAELSVVLYEKMHGPSDLSAFSDHLSLARKIQTNSCNHLETQRLPDLDRREWRQAKTVHEITEESGLEWLLEQIQIAEEQDSVEGVYMLHDLARSEDSLAESLFERAINLGEKALGPEHPDLGRIYEDMGDRYFSLCSYNRAEEAFERALAIFKKDTAKSSRKFDPLLEKLADTYRQEKKFEEASVLYRQILEPPGRPSFGGHHLAFITGHYAYVLRRAGHYEEADNYKEEAKRLRAKYPGK